MLYTDERSGNSVSARAHVISVVCDNKMKMNIRCILEKGQKKKRILKGV